MRKPKSVSTAFSAYTLGKKLGEGGSGYVYAAKDSAGKHVAIKFLNPKKATKEKRRRFKNEYLFCSRNNHKNVIKVIDYGIHEDSPFFVMPQYCGSIKKIIKALEASEKVSLFMDIIHGVEVAHLKDVIHRDLKPENVLCSEDMSEVVVTDFGIARFDDDDELYTLVETKAADRLANFKYRAPEQLERDGEIGPGTDIFSLGLMLNEFFTGKIPVGSRYKKIGEVAEDLAYLDPIVEKMIDQDIERRFVSIDELKKEIIKQGEIQVSRQKLAELNDTVISVEEPDDPLIAEPMQIETIDWRNGNASVTLNHEPTMAWLNAYNSIGNFSYTFSFHPHANIQFYGNTAVFSCESKQLQSYVNFFKGWLENANKNYEIQENQRLQREERELQERLEQQKKAEEERQAALSNLTY